MLHRLAPLALVASLFACVAPREPEHFEIIVLEHSEAAELVVVLRRAFAGPEGPSARVVADERTNSLIVLGDPAETSRVRALTTALDREIR